MTKIPHTCEYCASWETVDTEGTTICLNNVSPLYTIETDDGGSCPQWAQRELAECSECGWLGIPADLRGDDGDCPNGCHGTAVSPI